MTRLRPWIILFAVSVLAAACASQKLKIESEPSGGTVYINDREMGKTPLSVSYSELPYEDNLALRVELRDFGVTDVVIQGPKLAGIGEKVRVKLSKAPDEAAALNATLDRMALAHRLALQHRYIEAERQVDQLIADHPQFMAPRLLKGAILLMGKSYGLAQEQYQAVLRIDPGNAEAIQMLKYLDKVGDAPDGAARFPASTAVDSAPPDSEGAGGSQ